MPYCSTYKKHPLILQGMLLLSYIYLSAVNRILDDINTYYIKTYTAGSSPSRYTLKVSPGRTSCIPRGIHANALTV